MLVILQSLKIPEKQKHCIIVEQLLYNIWLLSLKQLHRFIVQLVYVYKYNKRL